MNLPRYAALCTGPITADVLNAYRAGDETGMLAYRRALDAGGVEPPDLPDLLSWGAVLGVEEHTAFWAVAGHLSNWPSPPEPTTRAAEAGGPSQPV